MNNVQGNGRLIGNPNASDEYVQMPRDSYELITELDSQYPERCISPHETLESAHRYAGMRDLIWSLKGQMQEEQDANFS